MSEREQIVGLMESMTAITNCYATCVRCGSEKSKKNTTEGAFAESLYDAGWRYVDTGKVQTTGALCPDCAGASEEES